MNYEANRIIVNNSVNYSQEEKIIGTWYNGKPLYERTFYVENAGPLYLNQSTNQIVFALPIEIEDIDYGFVQQYIFDYLDSSGTSLIVTDYSIFSTYVYYPNKQIRIYLSYNGQPWPTDLSIMKNLYITFRYTKAIA